MGLLGLDGNDARSCRHRRAIDWHWGWESLTSEVRGHFLGHWLSATAHLGREDAGIATKARHVVSELGRCQQANGGEWVGSFPPRYLDRISAGTFVWDPQYTLHKIIMGLLDQHVVAGNAQALEIVDAFATWFLRWTDPMDRVQLDDLLDWETGGLLEVWADLYALTGKPEHLELMRRYDRPRFFDPLLAGHDVLTNKHANTQIPEILGAARAWEVTGEQRWRDIVEAFWDAAVTPRGTYCTGGSTCGEVWQPPHQLSARLNSVQEHCTVSNMMRLAEVLFRWTGDRTYAAHWEANLANGVLAHQHPDTGMPTYFLPLAAGSTKTWGRPTEDFWCCHGTVVQAHASQSAAAVLTGADEIVVAQYLAADFAWDELAGSAVRLSVRPPSRWTATRSPPRPWTGSSSCDRPGQSRRSRSPSRAGCPRTGYQIAPTWSPSSTVRSCSRGSLIMNAPCSATRLVRRRCWFRIRNVCTAGGPRAPTAPSGSRQDSASSRSVRSGMRPTRSTSR